MEKLMTALSPQTRALVAKALHGIIDEVLLGQAPETPITIAKTNGTGQHVRAPAPSAAPTSSPPIEALTAEDQAAIRQELVTLVTTAAAANGNVSDQVRQLLGDYGAQRLADIKPKDLDAGPAHIQAGICSMTAHARLSPSAKRWLFCPGAPNAEEGLPDMSASVVTVEGTVAHCAFELALRSGHLDNHLDGRQGPRGGHQCRACRPEDGHPRN